MITATSLFEPTTTLDDRLEALGLSREILYEAVRAGEAARASCTFNDPPILPGLLAWGRTVRALGELLAPLGWTRRDEGNYSIVEDPRLGIAIAVATGDEATGIPDAVPRTKYPKGPTTAQAVQRNNQQLQLFDEPERNRDSEPTDARVSLTWIFLIARVGAEARCELSLPAEIGDDDRIEGWRERLILDPIRVNGDSAVSSTLEPTDEINIPVTLRAE